MTPIAPAPLSAEDQASLNFQAAQLKLLLAAKVSDSIGVSLSFLLHCAHNHPEVFRRCLNEPVVREGFRGVPMITVLERIAKSS